MVIDTGIFIEHLRKTNRANSHFSQLPPQTPLYVSAITVFELLVGATNTTKWGEAQLLLSAVTILAVDENVASKAAQLFQQMRGNIIGFADTLIAATALAHGLPIKTLNTRHFQRVDGLILL